MNTTVNLDIGTALYDASGVRDFHYPIPREIILPVLERAIGSLVDISRSGSISMHEQSVLRILSKWYLVHLNQVLYACALNKKCDDHAIRLKVPERFAILNAVKNGGEMPPTVFEKVKQGPEYEYLVVRTLKRLIRGLLKNRRTLRALTDFGSGETIVCFNPNQLLFQHHSLSRLNAKYTFFSDWFGPLDTIESKKNPGELEIGLLETVQNAFVHSNVPLPQFVENYMKKWISQGVCFAVQHLERLLKRELPKQLWTGSAGNNLWVKILTEATRLKQGEVTAHDHGGGNSHSDLIQNHFTEYSTCDVFFTYNQRSADISGNNLVPEYLMGRNPPKFRSLDDYSKDNKPQQDEDITLAGPIKSIFYVPTAFHGEGVRLRPILPDIVYFDWQVRLLSYLKNKGIDVLYKPHPDGRSKVPADFARKFGFRVNHDRFEDIREKPDAYLIDFIASSTNATIMQTKRPVIFIDPGYPIIRNEAKELLKKRCYYIPASIDTWNRMDIDWRLLDTVFANSNHSFSMQYAAYYKNS